MSRTREPLLNVLLAVASFAVCASLLLAWAWFRELRRPTDLERLSSDERQALVEQLLEISPGLFTNAWFEPRIGYILRPKTRIEAWNDSFVSNELGYRSGPAPKEPGVLRVLFVGDSWTFGMGVREDETFARQVERLAATHAAIDRRVEAWILALPGYNTFAQTHALWFFFDRLQPDVVVLCPTPNDNDSLSAVLPNGSLARTGVIADQFGEPHAIAYRGDVDSYRFRQRWRAAFAEIRASVERLTALEIPHLLFFTGSWRQPFIHHLIAEAQLGEVPFLITPRALTTRKWRHPPPIGHPTAAAHRIYGRMVYQGLAEVLGWPRLAGDEPGTEITLHRGALDPATAVARVDHWLAQTTRAVPESFVAGEAPAVQQPGPINTNNGLVGRATTVLIRRREGATHLQITLRRSPASSLYPLPIEVSIPSPSGGSRVRTIVPADGPDVHRFLLPLPLDLRPGTAADVIFSSTRTAVSRDVLAPRSFYLVSIEQQAPNRESPR